MWDYTGDLAQRPWNEEILSFTIECKYRSKIPWQNSTGICRYVCLHPIPQFILPGEDQSKQILGIHETILPSCGLDKGSSLLDIVLLARCDHHAKESISIMEREMSHYKFKVFTLMVVASLLFSSCLGGKSNNLDSNKPITNFDENTVNENKTDDAIQETENTGSTSATDHPEVYLNITDQNNDTEDILTDIVTTIDFPQDSKAKDAKAQLLKNITVKDFEGYGFIFMQERQDYLVVEWEDECEVVSDIIKERNDTISDLFNCKIEGEIPEDFSRAVTREIMSGYVDFDIILASDATIMSDILWWVAPWDIASIDFSKNWWDTSVNDAYNIRAKQLAVSCAFNTINYLMRQCIIYNRDLVSDE